MVWCRFSLIWQHTRESDVVSIMHGRLFFLNSRKNQAPIYTAGVTGALVNFTYIKDIRMVLFSLNPLSISLAFRELYKWTDSQGAFTWNNFWLHCILQALQLTRGLKYCRSVSRSVPHFRIWGNISSHYITLKHQTQYWKSKSTKIYLGIY